MKKKRERRSAKKRGNLNNGHLNRVILRGFPRDTADYEFRYGFSGISGFSLSRHEIYKRFSLRDLISGLNRKVSVRSRDPREDIENLRRKDAGKESEREREGGEGEGKMRSIKSAEWIRPQCRRRKESPSFERAETQECGGAK